MGNVVVLKILYHTASYLKDNLNDINPCKVMIYKGLSRILNLTIQNKMYKVILQKRTANRIFEITYIFIGTDAVPYRFILTSIYP